jgi:hypothetical protein
MRVEWSIVTNNIELKKNLEREKNLKCGDYIDISGYKSSDTQMIDG